MLIRIFIVSLVLSVLTFVVVRNDIFSNEPTASAYQSDHRQVLPHEIANDKVSSRLEQIKETFEDSGAIKYPSTDEIELLETEEALTDMVQEYENVKSDPELRKAHREKMAEQLSTYSDLVLPVALEKMK